MKGDFTRNTFKQTNHYSSVRAQQGRTQLDADLNEAADILAHWDRTTRRDIIGPCGGPQGKDDEGNDLAGFLIELTEGELQITKGRYYVDGILVENEADVAITAQLDLPNLPENVLADVLAFPGNQILPGGYLAYLDVWERHITVLEDPTIREVALGGPDTTTRTKVVWKVGLLPIIKRPPMNELDDELEDFLWDILTAPSNGQLTARAEPSDEESDPCIVPAQAGYRGLENQLYRVEIHRDSSDEPITIKWSRENGSVVFGWSGQDGLNPNKLTLSSVGRDAVLGLAVDHWVELTDDKHELRGEPGLLVRITEIEGNVLTVEPNGATVNRDDFPLNPKVRRWDMTTDVGEITITNFNQWIPLEKGIEVQLTAGRYRAGDYWLIPARTVTRDIEWPQDDNGDPLAQSSHGIEHHYCKLARLNFSGEVWEIVDDCRNLFPPLTEMVRFFYVSGDGQEAMPSAPELPKPLQVGVMNGLQPVENARVLFKIVAGSGTNGRLNGSETQIILESGTDGIYECTWKLDPGVQSQQVEASLLGVNGQPVTGFVPIRFNTNLSVASQVDYNSNTQWGDPDNPNTVQDALDQLRQNAALYYVSGDGQEAMPGGDLPKPLQVRVANGQWPVPGRKVTFKRIVGTGSLNGSLTDSASIVTGTDGVAQCNWTLDNQSPSQQVEAFLDGFANLPIRFNANMSIASQVDYDSGKPESPNTVQDALDLLREDLERLRQNAVLYYVSGDGQEAVPGGVLPKPLQVRVANSQGPVENQNVTFKITEGTGRLNGQNDQSVTIPTNREGLAECAWQLDNQNSSQQVEAFLGPDDASKLPIRFNANFDVAGEVDEDSDESGIHVAQVNLLNKPSNDASLQSDVSFNDRPISLNEFLGGIEIKLNQPIDGQSIHYSDRKDSKPVCYVTFYLRYPLTSADDKFWTDSDQETSPKVARIGDRPLIMDANVTLSTDGKTITWIPTAAVVTWLTTLNPFKKLSPNNIFATLTIRGNLIWGAPDNSGVIPGGTGGGISILSTLPTKERVYLNGQAFGQPRPDGTTGIILPTDKGQPGSDFEMWFWLVAGEDIIPPGIKIVFDPAQLNRISGIVRFVPSGELVEDAEVTLLKDPTTEESREQFIMTDAMGKFDFPEVVAGRRRTVNASWEQGSNILNDSQDTVVFGLGDGDGDGDGDEGEDIKIVFDSNLVESISGTVRFIPGEEPAVDAAVTLSEFIVAFPEINSTGTPRSQSTTTNSLGKFNFSEVVPGGRSVSASWGQAPNILSTTNGTTVLRDGQSGGGFGLNDISGIGPVFAERLETSNITQPTEVASLEPADLAEMLNTNETRAAELINNAQTLLAEMADD